MARWLAPTTPFDPRRVPLFYGWVMVAMVVLGILASAPGQTAGVSAFIEPLLAATGLARTDLASAYLVGTLLSGLAIPTAGRWVDRFGTRGLIIGACFGLAAMCTALAGVDHAGQVWARWLGTDPVTTTMVLLAGGFAGLRFTGQGLMTLCCQTVTGHWWQRKRGLATAISGSVLSVAGNATPLLLGGLVGGLGWNVAWPVLGLIVGPVFAIIAWCLWRDQPEACGLHPDGIPPDPNDTQQVNAATTGLTRAEALRTRAFWTIAGCFALMGLVITAVTFHLDDLGRSAGLDATAARSFLLVLAGTAMPTGLIAGPLADRIDPRYLLTAIAIALALHLVLMTNYGPGWNYALPGLSMGLTTGMIGAVSVALLPRYVGRAHLGAINGAQWAMVVIASAIGPWLYALAHDAGDYAYAMWGLLPLAGCLALSGATLKKP